MKPTTPHPIRGTISGLVAGFFGGLSLFLLGIVDSGSPLILVVMVLFPVLGFALGRFQPIRLRGRGGSDDDSAPGVATGD